MSFSSWVANANSFGHATVAAWFWITVLVALIRMKWRIFVFFPWWIFILTALYFTFVTFKNKHAGVVGAIVKVYAPFVVLIYWLAVYPDHNPWYSATETYLVIMAHIIGPVIVIIETFRARNTDYALFKQRNPDFPVVPSFGINTIVYFVYLGFYLLILPAYHDPIYTKAGFTIDEGRDTLIAIVGWIVVMGFNSVLATLTWHWRERELYATSLTFERVSTCADPNVTAYTMDTF